MNLKTTQNPSFLPHHMLFGTGIIDRAILDLWTNKEICTLQEEATKKTAETVTPSQA